MDVVSSIFLLFITFNSAQDAHLTSTNSDDIVPPVENTRDNDVGESKDMPEVCRVKMQCGAFNDDISLNSSSEDSIAKLKGDKGDRGFIGIPGIMGIPGKDGSAGTVGAPGVAGKDGKDGSKGDMGPKGERGEKGEKGETGTQGPVGPVGDRGVRGLPGYDGKPGERGQPGEIGKQGLMGSPGFPGMKGEPGEKGLKGEMGLKGDKGEQGLSIKGEKGEPAASPELEEPNYASWELKYKSISRPAESCQYLNIRKEGQNKENELYYVYPSDPFEVRCDFDNKEMCLEFTPIPQLEIPNRKIEFKKERAFWMTELKFDVYKFYGINFRQLMWFQAQANSTITQTIRFHCQNISVIPQSKDKTLQLLSWNQKLIDFEVSKNSPIHYEIPPEMDKCKDFADGDKEFKYTDVTLEGIPYYFPIVDFYIRDIRPHPQFGLFEPRQLCAKF